MKAINAVMIKKVKLDPSIYSISDKESELFIKSISEGPTHSSNKIINCDVPTYSTSTFFDYPHHYFSGIPTVQGVRRLILSTDPDTVHYKLHDREAFARR